MGTSSFPRVITILRRSVARRNKPFPRVINGTRVVRALGLLLASGEWILESIVSYPSLMTTITHKLARPDVELASYSLALRACFEES